MQLVFLYGRSNDRGHLLGIQFLTNRGRLSPVIGQASGYIKVEGACREDGAKPLVGLSRLGFASNPGHTIDWDELRVCSLPLRTVKALTIAQFEWSTEKLVEARYLAGSDWIGNWKSDGGVAFNMLSSIGDPTTARLSSIKVWSGSNIDALQVSSRISDTSLYTH